MIMFRAFALLIALAVYVNTALPVRAQVASAFNSPAFSRDAERFESSLKTGWKPQKIGITDLKSQAEKALAADDPRAAYRAFAQAAVNDPRSVDAWLGLARAMLAIKPEQMQGSERYEMPLNASAAAFLAYERATLTTDKVRALDALSDSLNRRQLYRPAIEALRSSVALISSPEAQKKLDKLINEHGFRIVDYKIDSEASPPRLCIEFTEPLKRGDVDFSKFISVDGRDAEGLVVDGKQICVEGLSHGKRYDVKVRADLPSDVLEKLAKTAELGVYVRDRSPGVRFSGKAYVLPSRGQQGLPVVSINTSKIAVEVYRVGDRSLAATLSNGEFQRQMSSYDVGEIRSKTGTKVYQGEMDVPNRPNEEVSSAIPVNEALGDLKPGVYAAVARPADEAKSSDKELATEWFIVSDLGLTALTGDTGVHAFVRSLTSAEPVAGVAVRLVARNNEVLAKATSDATGHVQFPPGLERGEGGEAPAILVAEGSGDYAFLDLTAQAFDLSDRGVKGRAVPGALDAYLYSDRGVYRAGESVHISGLVRDREGKAATVPMTLILVRPDGVEHARIAILDQGLGGRTHVLPLPASAMSGTWRARLHADPKADALSQISFLVEDFVPEKLDMILTATDKAIAPDVPAAIAVNGRYLYGAPASNLNLEGEIIVTPRSGDLDGYKGYVFGLADEKIAPVKAPLEGALHTDADGMASLLVTLPAIPRTDRPLVAGLRVRLAEPGGRAIERRLELPIDVKSPRIGLKAPFVNGTIPEGEAQNFEVIYIDAAGSKAAGAQLTWTLSRLDSSWQWYRRNGTWAYESATLTRKIASGTAISTANEPVRIPVKVDWGRYRLEVRSGDGSGPATSQVFSAGWYGSETADSPEMLNVALDKPSYQPGDTAKLRIESKLAGKALISVLGSGVTSTREIDVPKGGAEVSIPVDAGMGAGAYVSALLYRPMDVAAKRMPTRALGLSWLKLDSKSRELKVEMNLPDKVKSAAHMVVPVKITGLKAGEPARITVAAVDVGILSLTHFEAPAPEAWFNAQRQLGVEVRDLYGRLIDGMHAERGKLRSGGDSAGGMSAEGSPPTEATLALFSGIVEVKPDGTADVAFDLPDFNGQVRLMAVAWSADKVGHGVSDVIVRDSVALTASAPRFLTLGDTTRLRFDLHNVEAQAAKASFKVVETKGGVSREVQSNEVDLAAGERKALEVAVQPGDVGKLTYQVRVTGPNGLDVKRTLAFDVKPPAGDIKRTTVSELKPGGRLTLSRDLLADLIPGRSKVFLSVGPVAGLDVPGLLSQLDRYPYGCAEQTTSRALPLLYANELSLASGLRADPALKERIEGAIARVFEMQDSTGAFGVWGPSSGDMWLSAYVTDFLTRAKEAGFQVKPQGFTQALDRLANFVSYAQDFEKGGESRAYALYVLARNGKAPIGDLRYYADARLGRFSTPLAKGQIAAALAMMGDKERADKAFTAAVSSQAQVETAVYRQDYGSGLRDSAALLALATEARIGLPERPALTRSLRQAFNARTQTSTQEQAFMLLAAKGLGAEAKTLNLEVDGKPRVGAFSREVTSDELANGNVTVGNLSDQPTDATITVLGSALSPEPATSKGFKIERSFYTQDGKRIAPTGAGAAAVLKLNQADRIVVVLKIEATVGAGRVMLVDRLPAGLEVENPHLVDSGDLKALDWLKTSIRPDHTEFRDDRFVAAFTVTGGKAPTPAATGDEPQADDSDDTPEAKALKPTGSVATVAYIARAVSPGVFVHPAATVEDIYRPERYARTGAARLEVTAKR